MLLFDLFNPGDIVNGGISAIIGFAAGSLPMMFRYMLARRRAVATHELKKDEQWHAAYKALVSKFDTRVSALQVKVEALVAENTRCRSENETLLAKIKVLEHEIVKLKAKQDLSHIGGDAIIICNKDMQIIKWNPPATLVLHYLEEEAVGLYFTDMVADVSRVDVEHAIKRLQRVPGRQPQVAARLKTKFGAEVVTTISLVGWSSDDDQWQYGFTIRLI